MPQHRHRKGYWWAPPSVRMRRSPVRQKGPSGRAPAISCLIEISNPDATHTDKIYPTWQSDAHGEPVKWEPPARSDPLVTSSHVFGVQQTAIIQTNVGLIRILLTLCKSWPVCQGALADMIIELFGPPGAGKTTLLRRVCHGMAERGVRVKTVNGYRLIEHASASQDGPETRHGMGRIGRKIATCGPILLSTLPKDSVAARLLSSVPLRSRTWSWRMKVDIALLCESWHRAQESEGCFIFEEGLIQALCAMMVFARSPSIDAISDALAYLPRPDLLVQLDAPQETLRRRLVDRYAHQPFLEVLLFELGVERGLRQADFARQVGECLNRNGWPLIQVNGDDPRNFEKVIVEVFAGRIKEIALAQPHDVQPRFAGT